VSGYVWLRTDKNSQLHGTKPIAVRGKIAVIGKYVENRNYSTLGGNRTAPVLEALHYMAE